MRKSQARKLSGRRQEKEANLGRLVQLISQFRMSQKEVAEYLNVTPALVSMWLSGKVFVGLQYLRKLSEYDEAGLDGLELVFKYNPDWNGSFGLPPASLCGWCGGKHLGYGMGRCNLKW